MTGGEGPPRRWDDDSSEEDFEVRRAGDIDGLQRWAREQKVRPMADALESHGMLPRDGEGWTGPVILPDWWDTVPAPANSCPWCQRNVPAAPCPECHAAREQGGDPAAAWVWWPGLTPAWRRLHIAATYGTDPWSGRRCVIRLESTDISSDGEIRTTHLPYPRCAPDGIYWGAQRRELR